jgi:hypothetical protein
MHIKLSEEMPEEANVSLSSIIVVLKELFDKYTQATTIADAEKVSDGPSPVILPIVAFKPRRIKLKNNGIKNTFCEARLVAYSRAMTEEEYRTAREQEIKEGGKPKDELPISFRELPCARFIHEYRCCEDLNELFKQVPVAVRHAYFDEDDEHTVERVLAALGGVKSDKVSYFYNPCTCEGVITHSLAVIHEFGSIDNPWLIVTSYFSINVSK